MDINMKFFPILGTNDFIPYDMIKVHEQQALLNHGQNLETLKLRGGLDWCEIYCILRDKSFNRLVTDSVAKNWVISEVNKFNRGLISTIIESDKLGLRRCRVIRKQPKSKEILVINAYFHRWFDGTIDLIDINKPPNYIDKIKCVKALVEYEDGSMDEYHYKDIQFTDRGDVK